MLLESAVFSPEALGAVGAPSTSTGGDCKPRGMRGARKEQSGLVPTQLGHAEHCFGLRTVQGAQLAPHAQLARLAWLVLGTEQRQLCEASCVVP